MYIKNGVNSKITIFLFVILICGVFIECRNSDDNSNSSGNSKNADSINFKRELSGDLSLPKAYFSDPETIKKGDTSRVIVDNLIKYIDGAVKESDIYMNIYDFEDKSLAKALAEASERGVRVHVLIDSSNAGSWKGNKPVVDILRKSFKSTSGSEIVGFHNDISIDHHKHIAFSKLKSDGDFLKNVVFSTSSNFSKRQYEVLQDALVLGGDRELYAAIVDNWEYMKTLRKSGTKDNYNFSTYTSDDKSVIFKFLPLRKDGGKVEEHPFYEALNEVTDFKNDTIRIGMSLWAEEEPQIEIARRLLDMQKKGAQIEIILRYKDSGKFGDSVLDIMEEINKAGGKVFFLPPKYIIHSKYMMIKGDWKGKYHKWLIAGSTNFTNNAVWGAYDLVTFLKDNPVFDDYERNFKNIKDVFKN